MASAFNSNGNGDIKQIKSVPERQILRVFSHLWFLDFIQLQTNHACTDDNKVETDDLRDWWEGQEGRRAIGRRGGRSTCIIYLQKDSQMR